MTPKAQQAAYVIALLVALAVGIEESTDRSNSNARFMIFRL